MQKNAPVYGLIEAPLEGASLKDCLVLLHTNDLHGSVDAGQAGPTAGFAHLKSLKALREEQCGGVLLLDAGDTIHGRAEVHPSQGKIPMSFLVETGYDAMVPGNHDFNYGKNQLLRLRKEFDLPMLAVNVEVTATGEAFLDRLLIKEIGDWRVGLFGIASLETLSKSSPRHIEGLCLVDPIQSGQEAVAELQRMDVDLIVCLSHLGMDRSGPLQDDLFAGQVPGIDVIIGGHSHSLLEEGLWVGETLICQAGSYFSHVGELRIARDADGHLHKKALLHSNDAMRTLQPDVALLEATERVGKTEDNGMQKFLAEIPTTLDGERMSVRTRETNFGRLMADLIRQETGADFAIMNGGGIRAGIAAGPVRKTDVKKAFPFTNYSVLVEVQGAELLGILEYGLSALPEPAGRFPHISGGRLLFDPSREGGDRIVSLEVGGEALDPARTYALAINDFMAFGGDGYASFEDMPWLDHFAPLAELFEEAIGEIGFDAALEELRVRPVE